MTFTVKYRTSNGSIAEKTVEAANRADCFAKCIAQGIVPVGVSNDNNAPAASKRSSCNNGSKGGNLSRWVVCAIVLALAGGIVYFLVNGKSKPARESAPTPEKTRQIASVQPAAAPKPVAAPEKPKVEKKPKPQRVGEIRDGYRLLPSGRLHKVQGVITTGVSRVSIIEKTFKHDSDQMLAHLLVVKPGDTFIGDSEMIYAGFAEAFKKAMAEPIVQEDDDDDYVKELKMGVNDLRNELSERIKAGEDIVKVMIETRNQMQELGHYRQELENQVIKLSGEDGMTQKDYEDLLSAANQMLEERGSKPLELPTALKHTIRLRSFQNKTGEDK